MPESPEVQALADFLAEQIAGKTIASVDILEFRVVKTRATPPDDLVGESVSAVRRFGKHLDVRVGDRHLGISLGRHGWARWTDPGEDPATGDEAPHSLASIVFDDGAVLDLTDAGTWVSLGLSVTGRPTDVAAVAKLGPDPADADFSLAHVDAVVKGRRKQLKALLQEQESIAGVGNAYSDEILHRARLSPIRHASTLDDEDRQALFDATVGTIREAIDARRGIPIDQLKAAKVASMRVHGRVGEPCPVCSDTVREVRFGSSTADYCPTCQTGGAILG
jgi:formamidopyrimidine-DNA glycosylase